MRIAILSDFHLGYERFREDAFFQAEEALNKAAEMSDALIIPGDIFDNRAPKPDVIAEAINLFRNLSRREWKFRVSEFIGDGKIFTDLPIIAIPGTHERRAQEAADPVDILGLAGLVVDVSNATAVIQGNGERIAIRGIGGIADDRFREVLEKENPVPIDGAFNIFMFHESIYEMLPFNEKFTKLSELPKGFDLYVSGHIHNKVEEKAHGKMLLIPGSTVLTQLKAGEQDGKGFFVYDTRTGEHEFVRINSRRFVLEKIDLGNMGEKSIVEYIQERLDAIIKSTGGKPIIRVVLDRKGIGQDGDEMEINDIPRRYSESAVVEISRSLVPDDASGAASMQDHSSFENMSVKDYGVGVFLEKIKASGANVGNVGPVELLDLLGTEGPKDKIVKSALERLVD